MVIVVRAILMIMIIDSMFIEDACGEPPLPVFLAERGRRMMKINGTINEPIKNGTRQPQSAMACGVNLLSPVCAKKCNVPCRTSVPASRSSTSIRKSSKIGALKLVAHTVSFLRKPCRCSAPFSCDSVSTSEPGVTRTSSSRNAATVCSRSPHIMDSEREGGGETQHTY